MQTNDESYINLSIQWNRWLLKLAGLWPRSPDASMIEKIFLGAMKVVYYCLASCLVLPFVAYGALDVEDVYNKLKLFGPMTFFLMAAFKYYYLSVHEEGIRECVLRIEWDWKNVKHVDDRNVMIANAKFGRKMVIVCSFFMYGSFAFYYIFLPLTVGKVVSEDENVTYIPTAFPVSKHIVDTRYSPANEIFLALQSSAGILNHTVGAAACSLAAAFAVHANGQMEILTYWLKYLTSGREGLCETVDSRVAEIVKQHMRILKFLTITEEVFRQISFVEFLGCTMNLCLLSYYTLMEWSTGMAVRLTYSMLLLSFIFNIFIFCYIGELVTNQWTMIGQMSYMSDWYELHGKRKLSFVLIIAMSNTSKKLTAGSMIELSLTTFSDVIKSSFGFFNMLRTVT